MLVIQFKQSALFNPHGDLKKARTFPRGTHEVPDEILSHPFFHKLMKAGLVLEPDKLPVPKPESFSDRQKRLAEKIASQAKKPEAPSSQPTPPSQAEGAAPETDEAPEAEAEAESEGEDHEESVDDEADGEKAPGEPKKKKKKKR